MSAIVWWEIETSQPERFRRFHTAFSGWTFRPAFEGTELAADYWIIEQDGHGIGGLQRATAPGTSKFGGIRLYLSVDDLEDALARAVSLGGTIERSRTALGGDDRWFGIIRDSVGLAFGLWTEHPLRDDSS